MTPVPDEFGHSWIFRAVKSKRALSSLGVCLLLILTGACGSGSASNASAPTPGGDGTNGLERVTASGPTRDPVAIETRESSDESEGSSSLWGDEIDAPIAGSFPFANDLGYLIRAQLDYAGSHLEVVERVRFVNRTGRRLDSLPLVVEANRRAGVFHLGEIIQEDGGRVEDVELQASQMTLLLEPGLGPGEEIGFSIAYGLDLPREASAFGFSGRQINLGDWYPFVPPYVPGDEWLIRRPASVGEHLAYPLADYRVEIELLAAPEEAIIASSALAQPQGDYVRYELAQGRDFAWSVSADYEVLGEQTGDVAVYVFAFPEHRRAGEAALEAVVTALALYSNLFGPYPRAQFSLVESSFPDGKEFDGLAFMGQEYFHFHAGGADGYLTAIAVHEVSHQWWHAQVANDQALEPWLDEALATYSELLYYEHAYPELVDWWWAFRVHGFEPEGWVDSTIYDHRSFRSYVNAVYLRGALFLRDLRDEMGDPAFERFLQTYWRANQGEIVTAEDFYRQLPEGFLTANVNLRGEYFQDGE